MISEFVVPHLGGMPLVNAVCLTVVKSSNSVAGNNPRFGAFEFLRDRRGEARRRKSSLFGISLKFAFELKNMLLHIFWFGSEGTA
jgi:hypothetical protein